MIISNPLRSLFGYVHFEAHGGFAERFMNLVANNSISVWNVIKNNDALCACTYAHNYRKLRHIAREAGMKLKVKKRVGPRFIFYRYRKRIGICIGVAIFVALSFFFSGRIWTVEVIGNETMSSRDVMEYFSSLGVYPGAEKSNIDVEEICAYVIQTNGDIAWSSINIDGGNAKIEIHETQKAPEIVDDVTPYNVRAKYSGQILLVKAFSGNVEVKKGDAVEKGDLLISSVIENHDGTITYKSARGEIYAQTVHTVEVEVEYEQEIVSYTSETAKKKYLEFFGLKIPLFFKASLPEQYESEKNEDRLIILGKGLPIAITTETYKGTTAKTVTISPEAAKAQAYEQLEEKKQEIMSGAEIMSENITETQQESGFKIIAEFICNEDIAVQEKLIIE